MRLDVVSPPYRVSVAVATDPLLVTERRVSDSGMTRQLVPLARQTLCPATVSVLSNMDEPEAEVNPKYVEVEFVVVRFVPYAVVNPRRVAKRFVEVVLVPVAFVHVRFVKLEGEEPFTVRLVMVAFVAKKLVEVEFVKLAFVANRLVEVEFVLVVLAKYPFHRTDDEPRDCVASTIGLRSVVTPPRIARYVEVV